MFSFFKKLFGKKDIPIGDVSVSIKDPPQKKFNPSLTKSSNEKKISLGKGNIRTLDPSRSIPGVGVSNKSISLSPNLREDSGNTNLEKPSGTKSSNTSDHRLTKPSQESSKIQNPIERTQDVKKIHDKDELSIGNQSVSKESELGDIGPASHSVTKMDSSSDENPSITGLVSGGSLPINDSLQNKPNNLHEEITKPASSQVDVNIAKEGPGPVQLPTYSSKSVLHEKSEYKPESKIDITSFSQNQEKVTMENTITKYCPDSGAPKAGEVMQKIIVDGEEIDVSSKGYYFDRGELLRILQSKPSFLISLYNKVTGQNVETDRILDQTVENISDSTGVSERAIRLQDELHTLNKQKAGLHPSDPQWTELDLKEQKIRAELQSIGRQL